MAGPRTIDLVLLGGGHAHVEVLRVMARRKPAGLRLTVIAREASTPYSGLLPALLRREVTAAQAHIALAPLADAAGARLVVVAAEAIDRGAQRVILAGQPPVGFDLLSIDVGGIPSAAPGGLPVKPIGGFLDRFSLLESAWRTGDTLAVVGSGAGGTELALALAIRFAGRARIVLVGRGGEPVAEAPLAARRAVAAALRAAGVARCDGVTALGWADGDLALSDGRRIGCAAALWASGIVGPEFLAVSGLACDAAGCVRVDSSLRSLTDPRIFAAGDCAALADGGRPKAGVWAVRAGPALADNLIRAARGHAVRPWHPQLAALVILGVGGGRAVAWRGRFSLAGRLPARCKHWIDRRWIKRYASDPGRDLPPPIPPP